MDGTEREILLKRASEFRYVPGHGPNINEMTNEQLRKYADIMDAAFALAFSNKEDREEEEDI